jgi:hypothetical protein
MTIFIARNRQALICFVIALAYSPPGWCPPPPGSLLPDPVGLQFGAIELNHSKTLVATITASPFACFDRPPCPTLAIGDFPVNVSGNSDEFVIDPTLSTCSPGALVTVNTGCNIAIVFMPRAVGGRLSSIPS